jgi:hypothetical protein
MVGFNVRLLDKNHRYLNVIFKITQVVGNWPVPGPGCCSQHLVSLAYMLPREDGGRFPWPAVLRSTVALAAQKRKPLWTPWATLPVGTTHPAFPPSAPCVHLCFFAALSSDFLCGCLSTVTVCPGSMTQHGAWPNLPPSHGLQPPLLQ